MDRGSFTGGGGGGGGGGRGSGGWSCAMSVNHNAYSSVVSMSDEIFASTKICHHTG